MSYDPRNGEPRAEVADTPADEVEEILEAAAASAQAVGQASPATRAGWLRAVADALEATGTASELITLADRESALGQVRLTSELARTAEQLRFYATVAQEGSWLGSAIDHLGSDVLARAAQPLGPVAVFGASNFPFAFGVLGNDTASALAAGCPVVAKAHPAHPCLSGRLVEVATAALEEAGAPPGTLGLVAGFEAGTALVTSRYTSAVAFTGSQRGGLALWRLANEREVVIPVFAEMGTVNPVIMTAGGAERLDEVAAGFVGSFTLGMGQFCTKPGLLLAPVGSGAANAVGEALYAAQPEGWMLTQQMAEAALAGVLDLVGAGGKVIAQTARPDAGWTAAATVLSVPVEGLRRGSRLLEECFGPVALVAEYRNTAELARVLEELQGALAGAVMTGGADDPEAPAAVRALATRVGRVAVDQWPTGVAWTWAQQHGGPWPATSAPAATSVGGAALDRFTRPVAYQGVPDAALPAPLQTANPWGVPRRVDGVMELAR